MAPCFHALLLLFPSHGHIYPMVQLACKLVARGCLVTLVDTQRSHSNVLATAKHNTKLFADLAGKDPSPKQPYADLTATDSSGVRPGIRYLTISDGLPDSFKLDTSLDALKQILDAIQRQRGILEKYIESSKVNDEPISCIIIDFFFYWALDLADSVGVPGVVCYTSNATAVLFNVVRGSEKWTREAVEHDEVLELKSLCLSKDVILALLQVPDDPFFHKLLKDMRNMLLEASQVLVNSVRELEHFVDLPEPVGRKTWFVGPLLPSELVEGKANGDIRVMTSAFRENLEYIRWLEMQAESSVLYISFGTVAELSPEQIGEIAAGIEESDVAFLWVARPGTEGRTHLPEGFEERTKDRGRVIAWAEQLAVLMHPATGGFITHCGWNSVLESISMGVPMLCIPAFADQPLNTELVVKQWKVGMSLQDGNGHVTREYVRTAAKELMQGKEGNAMRERVGVWQRRAAQAAGQGGSSYASLDEFRAYVKDQS